MYTETVTIHGLDNDELGPPPTFFEPRDLMLERAGKWTRIGYETGRIVVRDRNEKKSGLIGLLIFAGITLPLSILISFEFTLGTVACLALITWAFASKMKSYRPSLTVISTSPQTTTDAEGFQVNELAATEINCLVVRENTHRDHANDERLIQLYVISKANSDQHFIFQAHYGQRKKVIDAGLEMQRWLNTNLAKNM